MEFLKELFGDNQLSWDQFTTAVTEKKFKIVDLSGGQYVDKQKYTDDIAAKDAQISTLNETIMQRDSDLEGIRGKLKAAGLDENKLETVLTELSDMQTKYENEKSDYEKKLAKQAYEFAVKEFAGEQKFTSTAAKRDFIRSMTEKDLKLEDGKILGADDFLATYKTENEDSFAADNNDPNKAKPTFTSPTGGGNPNNTITKEQFAKMGYAERAKLFTENKELYTELTKEE